MQKQIKSFIIKYGYKIFAICFWLLIWEGLSRAIAQKIFLVSPAKVLVTLLKLSRRLDFWETIGFSSFRIIFGFTMALLLGMLLAVAAYRSRLIRELVSPLMRLIKATPVASFIILALLWIKPSNLSVLISFLMVIPIIYANVGQGLKAADEKLLQMAKVFQISRRKKMIAIYLPAIIPYFISAVSVGLGFCWKAGIAAEVFAFPTGSIGNRLYEAKLYLMTEEIFAWTTVIIIISILFENVVMALLLRLQRGAGKNEKLNSE
jgi:NitT/TauT family transport system permease protein